MKPPHHHYVLILGLMFALVWVVLAINPVDRSDWMLENGLVAIFVPLMALT